MPPLRLRAFGCLGLIVLQPKRVINKQVSPYRKVIALIDLNDQFAFRGLLLFQIARYRFINDMCGLFIDGEPHTHIKVYCPDNLLRVDDGGGGVDYRGYIGLVFEYELFQRHLYIT